MSQTILDLDAIPIPEGASRGITQTLDPIEAASSLRRTVNGGLVNIGSSLFQKYRSTISCTDQVPPALDGVWPGQTITVLCVAELCYAASSGSPARDTVSGSERTEGEFTWYRPQLTMMVRNFTTSTNEFGAVVGWSLDLEEV